MSFIRITLIITFLTSLMACGQNSYDSTMGQGSVLTSIDLSGTGTKIDATEAQAELNQYCIDQSTILKMSNFAFNAGYAEHFEGSGYSGYLKSNSNSDRSCLAPTGKGDMYSQNNMAMFPPSTDSCLNDIYQSTCEVLTKSLKGVGGYTNITSRKNTSASGLAAGLDVNQDNCLTFDVAEPQRGYSATIAFCNEAFISTATASDDVSQDNKMALYLYR